jgi:hypothetical protein
MKPLGLMIIGAPKSAQEIETKAVVFFSEAKGQSIAE